MRPIDRARRLARALTTGAMADPADAAWFAEGFLRYEDGAPSGLTLCTALGLRQTGQHGRTWWKQEAHERRDAALRELRERHFAHVELTEAAREITRLAARRARSAAAPADRREALVDQALTTGAPMPQQSRLRAILRAA